MSRQQSQRSEHTHHTEGFEETDIHIREDDWNRGWKHNHEIEDVPTVADVWFFTAEGETEREYFGKHFADEEAGEDVVDVGEPDCELALGVVEWGLESEANRWD